MQTNLLKVYRFRFIWVNNKVSFIEEKITIRVKQKNDLFAHTRKKNGEWMGVTTRRFFIAELVSKCNFSY